MIHFIRFFTITLAVILLSASVSLAGTETVQDQDAAYKYRRSLPAQTSFPQAGSHEDLTTDLAVGVSQGVDTNPLLDSTHKADSYTQETLDMRFKYDLPDNRFGKLDANFGLSALNVSYYEITDVDIFDGFADITFNEKISKDVVLSAGYSFEALWFPNSSDGNYVGNEINAGFKQLLTPDAYHRFLYRFQIRNYLERKTMLGNGNLTSDLREDIRNIFRYEMGVYVGKKVKVRFIDDVIWNDSNDQYLDYYDYCANRCGASLAAVFTKKFYGVAGFYYQRKLYYSRLVSVGDYDQRDNLFTATASLSYDISRNLSVSLSYTHMENHTNEPLERYIDTLYYGGLNYRF